MNEEGKAGWDPESDPEYAQRLAPYLVRRFRWLLLCGLIAGGLVFGVVSLFLPSVYSTAGSVQVNKDVSTGIRLSSLLGGGPSGALQDEILILNSREIGLGVIDDLALQIEVYDPHGADSPWQRMLSKLGAGSLNGPRRDLYSRLRIEDIEVSEELLKAKELWISADGAGNWRIGDTQGESGSAVEDGRFSFTPVFGNAHQAGYSYMLTIQPDYLAWKHYREALKVQPAEDDANIISVRFAHANPLTAQGVVNRLIDDYLEYNQLSTYGDFDVLLDFIDEEAAHAETRASTLTAELQEFQEAHAVFNPNSQSAEAISRIGELSKSQTSLQIDMKQIDRQLGMLAAHSLDEFCQTADLVGDDPVLGGEFTALGNLIRNLELARETKTDEHPDVQQQLTNIDITVGQLQEGLRARRKQLEIAYREISGDVGGYRRQLEGLPAASSRIGLITAELNSNRQVLNLLTEQKAQTMLSRAGTSLKVRLLDAPPMPAKRDSPKIVRNGILGGMAGIFIVVVLLLVRESQNRNFRSLRELRLGLGLRVLSVLSGGRANGKWKPNGINDTADLARLGNYLTADTRLFGIVHTLGSSGGYDLAWSVAGILGSEKKPALLIDADKLEAGLSTALDLGDGPGLAEVAAAKGSAADLSVDRDGRAILRLGLEDIDAATLNACLGELTEQYSAVIICLPEPSLWTEQTRRVAVATGRLVITVPQAACSTSELSQAAADITPNGCQILGVVVTGFQVHHDYLGSQELRFVTIRPEKAV